MPVARKLPTVVSWRARSRAPNRRRFLFLCVPSRLLLGGAVAEPPEDHRTRQQQVPERRVRSGKMRRWIPGCLAEQHIVVHLQGRAGVLAFYCRD